MPTWVYDILTSPLFGGLVVTWLIIDIAAQKIGREFLSNLNILLRKPRIFEPDDKPEETVPLYVHGDGVANSFRHALKEPIQGMIDLIMRGIDYLARNIKDDTKPFLFIGYTLSVILLAMYLYLDAIGIVIVLIGIGLVSPNITEILQRFEYVAIGGSLFALLVGFYTWANITKAPSELSRWDKVGGSWKRVAKGLTFILVFLGFIAVMFLALALLVGLGWFPAQSAFINGLVDFSSVWLTRVNSALASVLLLEDGIMGLVLLIIVVLAISWALFVVLQYIARIIGSILPVVVDFIYRVALGLILLAWFLITTPILLVVSLFQRISDDDNEPKPEPKLRHK